MAKKKKDIFPDEFPDPEKNPEFNPDIIPEESEELIDESDWLFDDDDNDNETPSYEIPKPGEGP